MPNNSTHKKKDQTQDSVKLSKELAKKAMDISLELSKYLQDNGLDPDKDWTKDPVHGDYVTECMMKVRQIDRKIKSMQTDRAVTNKIALRKELTRKKKLLKKPDLHPKVKEASPYAYDYPDVDGMPMSRLMKRKYRAKMRRLLRARVPVKKAQEMAKEFFLNGLDSIVETEQKIIRDPSKARKHVKRKSVSELKSELKKVNKELEKKGISPDED